MDRNGVGRRWRVLREFRAGSIMPWVIVLAVGLVVMTIGTIALSEAFGFERPSLEPLGTTFVVLAVGLGVFWGWRQITIGGAYVELGVDALVIRAGMMVDLRIPYPEIVTVRPPPAPIAHWEGMVGYHPASRAARVGSGHDCLELEVIHNGRWGRFPVPRVRYSKLWLGVHDPDSLVEALRARIGNTGTAPELE
jgi:hypothetical protein